jgi:hypothetical protein
MCSSGDSFSYHALSERGQMVFASFYLKIPYAKNNFQIMPTKGFPFIKIQIGYTNP